MTVLQITMPAAYAPDPRNGEVYVTFDVETLYEPDGQQFDGPLNYMWICRGRNVSCKSGFTTLQSANRAALKEAKRLNAVFSPLTIGGQR